MNAFTEAKHIAAAELFSEEVSKRVAAAMLPGAKHDPLTTANLEEALNQTLGFTDGASFVIALADALRAGESANKLIADMATAYWRKWATVEAENELLGEIEYERNNR